MATRSALASKAYHTLYDALDAEYRKQDQEQTDKLLDWNFRETGKAMQPQPTEEPKKPDASALTQFIDSSMGEFWRRYSARIANVWESAKKQPELLVQSLKSAGEMLSPVPQGKGGRAKGVGHAAAETGGAAAAAAELAMFPLQPFMQAGGAASEMAAEHIFNNPDQPLFSIFGQTFTPRSLTEIMGQSMGGALGGGDGRCG